MIKAELCNIIWLKVLHKIYNFVCIQGSQTMNSQFSSSRATTPASHVEEGSVTPSSDRQVIQQSQTSNVMAYLQVM